MPVNPVAENVLGTIGTILWSGQIIPQIWKSWRTHSTTGLSPWLVFLWGISSLFLGVYVIVQRLNIPLIIQPHLFGFLCFFSWGQCLYYERGQSRLRACLIAGSVILVQGAMEVAMVFAIRPSMNRRAIDFFGIFASVLVAAGLLPQYVDIVKRKEVVGISITFMTVDILGGLFSDLSLVFRPELDAIAATTYTLVIVMDSIIVIAAVILNPRARRRRRHEAERDLALSNRPPQLTQSSTLSSTLKSPHLPDNVVPPATV